MGSLIINTVNLGVQFIDENSGARQTLNEFSVSRYTNTDNILDIISDIKPNFTPIRLVFDSYDSVTFDSVPILNLDDLETALKNVTL